VLPASTGGVPGWRRAGGVEAWLTLAVARRAGAERGVSAGTVAGVREEMGSGERWGGGREAGKGDAGAVSERRGGIATRWREISTGDGGSGTLLKGAAGTRAEGGPGNRAMHGGGAGESERGPGAVGERLGSRRAAALPRDSGGRWGRGDAGRRG
jgi:hypothetical protein